MQHCNKQQKISSLFVDRNAMVVLLQRRLGQEGTSNALSSMPQRNNTDAHRTCIGVASELHRTCIGVASEQWGKMLK